MYRNAIYTKSRQYAPVPPLDSLPPPAIDDAEETASEGVGVIGPNSFMKKLKGE
jgi:hypothetical protein